MAAMEVAMVSQFPKAYRDKFDSLMALYDAIPPEVSFEFFPPSSSEAEENLWETIKALEPLAPRFVSVTYGAGGSTREHTHNTVKRIANETTLTPAAHLTCVNATRKEVDAVARDYWDAGIKHIVALRGDPLGIKEGERYVPHPDGYPFAVDLVKGLKEVADFEISVAVYPEMHPEAVSAEADLVNLRKKLEAGATRGITQFFFDIDHFLRFRDRCDMAGIEIELTPGIMPIRSFKQVSRFAKMCGTEVPPWIQRLFEPLEDSAEQRAFVTLYVACEQARLLRREGVKNLHFYTMNKARQAAAICHILGITPNG
jgi:methylenetetrahydrofolate reductase (NADPH)